MSISEGEFPLQLANMIKRGLRRQKKIYPLTTNVLLQIREPLFRELVYQGSRNKGVRYGNRSLHR
jgi:hypothetical protein